ncbi:MAG TPA: dihydrolipoamide acetyltransferase family protein [Candidatus Dormibacteraeota bacterium]|nr:dihydrolipoamide acetyltransferase family protein [Candidatus Dormibacteraeota bacterium]
MPKLSDTMEEGTVLEWKVKDGDTVKKGDVLAEIESDKASFEINAETDGILRISVEQGRPVPVGDVIGQIGDGATPASAPPPPTVPTAVKSEPKAAVSPAAPPASPSLTTTGNGSSETRRVSPLARRLAREMGVDLALIQGSGPEGRIVKEDVVAAGGNQHGVVATPAFTSGQEVEVEEPTRMQATIARRMVESKTTVPHFYATMAVRVDEAEKLRQQIKAEIPLAAKLTMTDLLLKACALALGKFPEVNASWVDGHFERKRGVNIGLAVPPASGLGLLVPVIHNCDRKSLVALSVESRQVIERARSGKPADGDLSGGTFSISNLGMLGVEHFQAIVNPPESAILAVGAAQDVPLVENGQIKIGKLMKLTLSVDHRVFYGQTAALFLGEVRRLIENPVTLVL